MWHDNETFLQQPKEYKKAGLVSMNFPPNSGDLNPIEAAWAKLRKQLAERQFEDLVSGKVLSKTAFRKRVSQLLVSYSIPSSGEKESYLEKLVKGMPRRIGEVQEEQVWPLWQVALDLRIVLFIAHQHRNDHFR